MCKTLRIRGPGATYAICKIPFQKMNGFQKSRSQRLLFLLNSSLLKVIHEVNANIAKTFAEMLLCLHTSEKIQLGYKIRHRSTQQGAERCLEERRLYWLMGSTDARLPVQSWCYSGMLPCFLRGLLTTLFSNILRPLMSLARVMRGSITSSI